MRTVFITGGSGFVGRHLVPLLVERGFRVRALARSDEAAARVTGLGAEAIRGDLDDDAALRAGCAGASDVVHCAALMAGDYQSCHRVNVLGTQRVLAAARSSGSVTRLIMVGAAASIVGARRVHDADETWPLVQLSYFPYAATKSIAEEQVLAASAPGFVTSTLRPGWVWGNGDPVLGRILDAARSGKMMWIDGSVHEIVTSHIDNVCHALLLVLARGAAGQAYFVFDDDKIVHRTWLSALLAAHSLPAPTKSIPYRVAFFMAFMLELIWRLLRKPGAPPISRAFVRLTGQEFTVSDGKARRELGYAPIVARAEGLRRLAAAAK